MTENKKDIGRMSFNNGMATPFASHLFPYTEGTLLMYTASLAQQMAKNVKNESILIALQFISHYRVSRFQLSTSKGVVRELGQLNSSVQGYTHSEKLINRMRLQEKWFR